MLAAPETGGGSQPAADGDLTRLSAADAVATLDPERAADNLPDVHAPDFPGPVAEAAYWSDADIVGLQGPVGSGKTTTMLKSRMRRAVQMPRSVLDGVRRYKLLLVRETYRQLWSTTIPSYLEVFPKALGKWSGGRGDPVSHVIAFDDPHGPIEFTAEFMAYGDDIFAAMRGVQTTDLALNEADTLPVEILTVGIGRIDRWPGRQHLSGYPPELQSYGQIIGDFNAPDEDNWTFRVFHDPDERKRLSQDLSAELPQGARRIEIAFYNQPGYGAGDTENLHNLSPSYYQRQIASMTLAGRGDMVERLVRNRVGYLRIGDPVFRREFSQRVHVADAPLEVRRDLPLRIGLDQGFRGAAVVAQLVPPYHWLILAELFHPDERLMARTFGARLRTLLESPRFAGARIEAGWGDMAGEHGASQAADENATWNRIVGRAAGFAVKPQRIGTNRIQPRLEAVRAALEYLDGGLPGLLIDPGCKHLIRGFAARYVWSDQPSPSGEKRKVPDKSVPEANVLDALQYLLLSEHRPDGTSPITFPANRPGAAGADRPGAPDAPRGLAVGHDVLNPYGGR